MMLDVKKQYMPSLDPISEVLDLDQLTITQPIIREGFIRREVGFVHSWKQRILVILFAPRESLMITVYTKDSGQPEEVIDLQASKLSKKCTEVDQRICFGLVTPQKRKYLIALKSNRDCLKFFYEIVSAKKMLKMDILRMMGSNISLRLGEELKLGYSQAQDQKEIKPEGHESMTVSAQFSRGAESGFEKQLSQYFSKVEEGVSPTQSQKSVPMTRCDTMKTRMETEKRMAEMGFDENQENYQDRYTYQKLQSLEGYKLVQKFPKCKIYQNKSHFIKVVSSVQFDQSARSMVELFVHFDMWNSGIKSFKIFGIMDRGVYKTDTHFHKTGCFSKEKSCQNLLSLYKVHEGYFFNLRAMTSSPFHKKKDNELTFNVAVQIKESLEHSAQKKMIISIESDEDSRLLLEFAKEMRNFQKYLQTNIQLPPRLIEIKGTLQK